MWPKQPRFPTVLLLRECFANVQLNPLAAPDRYSILWMAFCDANMFLFCTLMVALINWWLDPMSYCML